MRVPFHQQKNGLPACTCRLMKSIAALDVSSSTVSIRFLVSGPVSPAGRLRGSRNKLSEAVICALLRDFSKHGEKAIAKVRRTQPAAYLKILALMVPREHKVEHRNPLKELTDEELEAMIEHLKASIEAQAQSAKLIEGEAVPSLPSPVSAKNS